MFVPPRFRAQSARPGAIPQRGNVTTLTPFFIRFYRLLYGGLPFSYPGGAALTRKRLIKQRGNVTTLAEYFIYPGRFLCRRIIASAPGG
jgi:hypothetical protein